MTKYLIIGLGGFVGANLRYLVGGWVADRLGSTFPYGTLVVNASGSFLLGLILTVLTERYAAPPAIRLFFAIGVLGAYTTFSTFSYESLALLQTRAYLAGMMNMLGSLVLAMVAVMLGVIVGRLL